tara:strand:+ start:67 stop:840 length:774 start_codon:yes stop_codon:yes gene_type:complete
MNKFSIAIPTYYSSKFIKNTINPFIGSGVVSEIVISEDSNDELEFNKLTDILKSIQQRTSINIRVIRNKDRLGAFHNKFKSIKNCNNSYVYQIDSDNIPGKNIEDLLKNIEIPNKTIIYPSSIKQFRKLFFNQPYPKEDVILSKNEVLINKNFVKEELKNKKRIQDKDISWVLNIGNFIVKKSEYVDIVKPKLKEKEFLSADAVALSYFWLESGYKIKLLENFYHYHRKRDDSVSFTEGENSQISINHFIEKFKESS